MKAVAEKAGIDNSLLTNHSARKRLIQTMNGKVFLIVVLLYLVIHHKNFQSLNNYSHVSQEQQKGVTRLEWLNLKQALLSLSEQQNKVQRPQQQQCSKVLCFSGKMSPSISTRPRLQRKYGSTQTTHIKRIFESSLRRRQQSAFYFYRAFSPFC